MREYQPGDNYRDIDWNVSARLGQLYIKKYRETRELRVVFLVDVSASQEFGTRSMIKREKVAELVAALAFSAVANQDLAGLILFSDEVERFLPTRKGRNNALAILREVLYYEPKSKKTSLKNACEYAHKMLKKRCILFIISDWIDSGYEHSLKILATKNDVIALRVLDDSELELPNAGIISFQDPETGEEVWINSSDAKLRKAYQEIVNKEQKDLEEFFRKCNCDYLLIRTSDSYINSLRKFFTLRGKRK